MNSANTAKQKVLAKYPKAYACYVGLSLQFVIRNDFRGADLSGHRTRERDAWADAARKITS